MTDEMLALQTVIFVVTSLGLGGADQQVRQLAAAFRRRGWRVVVVSLVKPDPYPADLVAGGVHVETLAMRPGIPDPRGLGRLARLLRSWQPTIVHGHMIHANILTRLVRLLVPAPVVISTIHSQDEGRQWRYVAYRLTHWLADLTTAVSGAAASAHLRRGGAPGGEVEIVPNGIPLPHGSADPEGRRAARAVLGLGDREFAWLTAGRFVRAKGYENLIAALPRVLERSPEARLLIAGGGPELRRIQNLVAELDLGESVRLLGVRDDMAGLMAAVDGFVLSSLWEGLPMVLLEAASSELPIVTTDVGGTTDIVANGLSGVVVPPGDVDALAGAMSAVMSMPDDERRVMAQAAFHHVTTRYDLERVVDDWEDRYNGLLAVAGGRRHRRAGRHASTA